MDTDLQYQQPLQPYFVDAGGHRRYFGNKPGPIKYNWKQWGESKDMPRIPRSQWKPVDLGEWVSPTKDQDGQGACNAFATVAATEASRRFVNLKHVLLSPGHLYGRINGGQDEGSMLEDAIREAVKGIAPASVVPELEWRSFPRDVMEQAAPYAIDEWVWCPTFDDLACAAQCGFFSDMGIMWYENYEPDGKGRLPKRGQGRPGGHAICGCGLDRTDDGTWWMKMINSWGPGWGPLGGFAWIPESAFAGPVGGWWACRTTRQEDQGDGLPAPRT